MKFKLNLPKNRLTEDMENSIESAVEDYFDRLGIDGEAIVLTDDTIDENLLSGVCNKYGCMSADVRNRLLEKGDTIDAAAREEEAQAAVQRQQHRVMTALDECLEQAKEIQETVEDGFDMDVDFPNLFIVGPAGTAKTSVVKRWAKTRGINLVYKDLKVMDPSDLSGVKARDAKDPQYSSRMASKEFHVLDQPNSVLFLDEYNRAGEKIRATLLTLIQDHTIWDPSAPGEMRYLPNFMFTVIAMNPKNGAYSTDKLDNAESTRGRLMEINYEAREQLNYLEEFYEKKINVTKNENTKLKCMGRLGIAQALLTDPDFKYTTPKEEEANEDEGYYKPLSYRTLHQLLEACDGTKADFLGKWTGYITIDKKAMAERILNDYVDVKDKANSVFEDEEDEEVDGDSIFEGDDDLVNQMDNWLKSQGL